MVSELAFNEDEVRRLTKLSRWKLRHWVDSDVVTPDYAETFKGGPRLYSFQDLVELRVLAQLRAKHSLQALRQLAADLRTMSTKPFSRLRLFLMAGGGVCFRDPESGKVIAATGPRGQVIEERLIDLEEIKTSIRDDAAAARRRSAAQHGRIVQRRGVLGNAPTLEGTRIPVETIQQLSRAGMKLPQLLKEYPRLTEADVRAALEYEAPRRRKRPA